jgi:lysophospholipase L1-like esterase
VRYVALGDCYTIGTAVADADRWPDQLARCADLVILDHLVGRVWPGRIVVVAIPDSTVAPRWTAFGDPAEQSDTILRFNAIMREACEQRDVCFVPEVFEISREAAQDRGQVAVDGFHPSGPQYERWVDAIEPVVRSLLDP